jgi:hypothetical protein
MPEIDVGRHLDMFPLAGYMLGIDEKGCWKAVGQVVGYIYPQKDYDIGLVCL